ncbi:MAG: putative sigma-54 modulation protein [Phycisphaerales bacterium]|jgi:putative sigma-54 modulation protein
MRIEVIGRQFDITDSIREYAEKKSERLTRYLDTVQLITWTIGKQSSGPDEYWVEIVIDVERHAEFVSKAISGDVYASIDAASDKASRQLIDFKEKLKQANH